MLRRTNARVVLLDEAGGELATVDAYVGGISAEDRSILAGGGTVTTRSVRIEPVDVVVAKVRHDGKDLGVVATQYQPGYVRLLVNY